MGFLFFMICQKGMTSQRQSERCQRPKTSWFDFVFPFAFENKHQFQNFFALIMQGIDTLNYNEVKGNITHSVLSFLLNAS